jgi:hypothetical protein
MKKMFIIFVFILFAGLNYVSAQSPTTATSPRYAKCDLCGYCPPNVAPQSWAACQKCLYPDISSDPSKMESLKIDPETNLPITPAQGKQYTLLGCLGGIGGGFTDSNAAGGVVQSLLNIIFSLSGGIAFLYLLYGSFIIITSQSNPERINYGKRMVYGSVSGLIFVLVSVYIVKFIASGVLKIPGFGD